MEEDRMSEGMSEERLGDRRVESLLAGEIEWLRKRLGAKEAHEIAMMAVLRAIAEASVTHSYPREYARQSRMHFSGAETAYQLRAQARALVESGMMDDTPRPLTADIVDALRVPAEFLREPEDKNRAVSEPLDEMMARLKRHIRRKPGRTNPHDR